MFRFPLDLRDDLGARSARETGSLPDNAPLLICVIFISPERM
jgi:hypothetical protein